MMIVLQLAKLKDFYWLWSLSAYDDQSSTLIPATDRNARPVERSPCLFKR